MSKKVLSVFLALVLSMSVFTCALAKAPEPPKQTTISTDPNKPFYAHEASYIPNAWMTFAMSQSLLDMLMKDSRRGPFVQLSVFKPGASLDSDMYSTTFSVKDKEFDLQKRGTLWLRAPKEPGTYDVIAFDSTYSSTALDEKVNERAILARTKIVVRKNSLNSFNFRLNKTEFCKFENIRVELSGLTEQHSCDKADIRICAAGAPHDEFINSEYVYDYPNDVIYLTGTWNPGKYEIRAYFAVSYPTTEKEFVKKIPFTVVDKTLPDGPRAQGGGSFDNTVASRIVGDWSSNMDTSSAVYQNMITGNLTSVTSFSKYAVNFGPDGSYKEVRYYSGQNGTAVFTTKGKWRVDKELLYVTDVTESATYLGNSYQNYKDDPVGNQYYNVTIKTDKKTGKQVLDMYRGDKASHDRYYAVEAQ